MNDNIIKINEHNELIKNSRNGVISNTNKAEFEKYIKSKNRRELDKNRIDNIENEISQIRKTQDMILKAISQINIK